MLAAFIYLNIRSNQGFPLFRVKSVDFGAVSANFEESGNQGHEKKQGVGLSRVLCRGLGDPLYRLDLSVPGQGADVLEDGDRPVLLSAVHCLQLLSPGMVWHPAAPV